MFTMVSCMFSLIWNHFTISVINDNKATVTAFVTTAKFNIKRRKYPKTFGTTNLLIQTFAIEWKIKRNDCVT